MTSRTNTDKPVPITKAILLRAKSEKENKTYKELAEMLLGDSTRDKELRAELDKYTRKQSFQVPSVNPVLMESPDPEFTKPLKLKYEPTLIISDTHSCNHDADFLCTALDMADQYNIKRIIHAGDVFNADALSNQSKPWEIVRPLKTDLDYGYAMLDYITAEGFELIIVPGNHDEWVMRQYGIGAVELFPRWKTTEYPYLYIGKKIMVGHLETTHNTAGYLAAQIAKKFNKTVFVGHDHITGAYVDEEGYVGVSIGGMLVGENIYYKQTAFNPMPQWNNGFVILMDEKALLYRKEGKTGVKLYDTIDNVS